MTRKLLSILIAVLMVLSIVPMAAIAQAVGEQSERAAETASLTKHADNSFADKAHAVRTAKASQQAEPKAEAEPLKTFSFETEEEFNTWKTVNKGYGPGWKWNYSENASYQVKDGYGWVQASSYENQTDYNCDDWLISPEITLEGAGYLTFWATNYSSTWPDHVQVYAGETDDPDAMTAVSENYAPGTAYTMYTVDLAAYAGKTFHIAFRHKENAQYRIFVDLVKIWAGEPVLPETIDTIEVSGFVAPKWNAAANAAAITVADDAPYSMYVAFWRYWNSDTNDTNMEDGELFNNEAYKYYCVIAVEAKEGYEFASSPEILINGDDSIADPEYCGYNADVGVYVIFTKDYMVEETDETVITEINVLNVVAPEWNAAADVSGFAVPEDAHYTINPEFTCWKYYSDVESNGGSMANTDVFNNADMKYYLLVGVTPEEGYTFAEDAVFTINGSTEYVEPGAGGFEATDNVFYTRSIDFTVEEPQNDPNAIHEVKLVGFTEPAIDATPDNKLGIGGIAYVDVTVAQWRLVDETPVSVFTDGTYYQYIELTPIYDVYYFANDITVTINGSGDYVASTEVVDGVLQVKTIEFKLGEDPEPEDKTIDTIEINGFVEPEWNGVMNIAALTVPEDAHYSIADGSWASWGSRTKAAERATWYDDGDLFDNEHVYYYFVLIIEPEEGYTIAEDAVVLINGSADYVDDSMTGFDDGDFYVVSADFTVDDPGEEPGDENVIDTIEINGFVEPEWNAAVDTTGYTVPDGANYSIVYAYWSYWNSSTEDTEMNEGDLFNNEAYNYYLTFFIMPEDGYEFAASPVILINGDDSIADPNYCLYYADYDIYVVSTIDFNVEENGEEPGDEKVIDKIDVLNFAVPEWGASADVSVLDVPEDANYTIDYDYSYWYWADESWENYAYLQTAEDLFNREGYYYIHVEIIPDEGYVFADDIELLLNGSDEYIGPEYCGYDSEYGVYVIETIEFELENPYAIKDIEIDYAEPSWEAAAADCAPTIPEDARYEIVYSGWSWESEEDYGDLADEDLFDDELIRYYFFAVVAPKEGETFGSNVTAFLNGDEYMVAYSEYDEEEGLYYIISVYYTVVDPATLVAEFNFETDPEAEGWKFVDKDNDHTSNLNWYWEIFSEDYPYLSSYQGKGLISSASYVNGDGAYEPDNWAISPAIKGAIHMSFYLTGQDPSYCEEHFAVYAGLTSRPGEMTEVMVETEATGSYIRYEVDLSEFAGQTIYVAFRHFNCYDQFMLNVDHVVFTRPIVWGDADCDCQVTATDALLIMRYVQGIITEDDIDIRYLDVNADGKIDLVDALLVLRKAMDIYTDPFPAELPPEDEPDQP